MNATRLGSISQAILLSISFGFYRRGEQRFVAWATGLALHVEEHTITQSLIALGRPQDWRAQETFAEYGPWDIPLPQGGLARRLERLPNRLWHGYRVWAGDDTKVQRGSEGVWGTCTFREYSARSPNRASTVRAHNWVVTGALLPVSDEPALFVPVGGSLYFRKSQMPAAGKGPREAARAGAGDAPAGPEGAVPEVGQADAATAAGGSLGGAVAGRAGPPVRPAAAGALQGGDLPVARAGPRRAGQGGRRRSGGLLQTLHAGQQRH